MIVYAVDDERYMLEALEQAIRESLPEAELKCFRNSRMLLEEFGKRPCDIVFLDIEMPVMTGVELAAKLIEIKADINIFFLTAYDQYKADAMDLKVCDYLMKPVTAQKIIGALKYIRYPIENTNPHICAVTFGNFALYVDKKIVNFHRKKSAELLAYLIDRCGTVVTRSELTLILLEDESHSRKAQKYLDSIYRTLVDDLVAVGAEKILYKGSDGLAVNREFLSADLFDYLEGNRSLYAGQYMQQYSWGEYFKANNIE